MIWYINFHGLALIRVFFHYNMGSKDEMYYISIYAFIYHSYIIV